MAGLRTVGNVLERLLQTKTSVSSAKPKRMLKTGATIMTNDDWKTLRVPTDAYEKAKAQKEERDRTWGEQLVSEDPGPERESVDGSEIAKQVVNDLQSTLPRQIAEELQ